MNKLTSSIAIAFSLLGLAATSCAASQPYLWSEADTAEWIAQDTGAKLRELESTDKAVMEYHFWGCFGNSHYRLELTGGDSAEVAVYEVVWDKKPRSEQLLTEIVLTPSEISELDRGLSIFRANGGCFSSGSVELRVTWYRDGRRTLREKLDRSLCGGYEEFEVLFPGDLIERALKNDT